MRTTTILTPPLALAIALILAATATCKGKPEVEGREVTYSAGGVELKGYLAVNKTAQGRRPAVLVVHEWWGHNAYARRRARMLAALGYTALAVDMYGQGKQAKHPKDAMAFSGSVMKNFAVGQARFGAAMNLLKQRPEVDGSRLGAIGYCFGGAVVLNMARQGADLKAVASFHGNLSAVVPAKKGGIKAQLLVLNGGADPFVKPAAIQAFKQEMKDAGANLTFVSYPGALHAFTNPDADANGKRFKIPLAYHPEADRKSWQTMRDFFKKHLE